MHKVRWILLHGFCSKFHTLSTVQKFWTSVKVWQSYKQLKGRNFFLRHNVVWHWLTFGWRVLLLWICTLHTQPQPFYGPFSGTTQVSRCQKIFFWTFMVQGKIIEADTPTIQLGATPSGLISGPPLSSPISYRPDALPAITLPLLWWLGTVTKYAG